MRLVLEELRSALGEDAVTTERGPRERLSRDFAWFSPVLNETLRGYSADVVTTPRMVADLRSVVSIAARNGVPMTMRGAGTGNYGQCVPLQGGILVDITRMDAILSLDDSEIRAEAGARMGHMEDVARREGRELTILPSTYEKSTIAGFIAGGAGGIGSINHGWLWDGNVTSLSLLTVEPEPRLVTVEGDDLKGVLHAYGTTGVIVDVTVPLVPSQDWTQLVLNFPTLEAATLYAIEVGRSDTISKRLVSVSEASMSPLLNAGLAVLDECGCHSAAIWVDRSSREAAVGLAKDFGGWLARELPYGRHPMLSDLGWNHVTLWARKVDSSWTYLQSGFDPNRVGEQIAAVKERYGDDLLIHFEIIRSFGQVQLAGLVLIRAFHQPERIPEMVAFLEDELGIGVSNPHTHYLEDGGRRHQRWDMVYSAKDAYDPQGLLNPAKLRGWVPAMARQTAAS